MSRLLAATQVAAVDPVAAVQRLSTDGDDGAARLVPGSRLLMHVLTALPDGGVRARIVGGTAEYRLPFNAPPGAELEVLVTGSDPRPTFALARGGQGVDTSISNVARLLAALAQPSAEGIANSRTDASAPPLLVRGGPIDVPALARAFEQALVHSGLFYESHQAQWVAGTRTREALLREPQMRLTLRELPVERDAARSEPAAAARLADTAPPARAELDGVVHRETVSLVQQQLMALETGTLLWRGEAWRGQPLQWEVTRDGAEADDGAEAEAARWHTRLRLTLPHLGEIDATVGIDARGIEVRIAAPDRSAAATLRNGAGALAAALTAAGLSVRAVEVRYASV